MVGDVRQDLTVQIDPRQLEAVDQTAVRDIIQARGGVDSCDP